jgi:hypothetical protein
MEQDTGAPYLEHLTPGVVRNLGESVKVMIDGGFALKADGMEKLEGGDGDGALGVVGCCGVLAVGQ